MRMDDDSIWDADVGFDPFKKMQKNNLTYVYRSMFTDARGLTPLWRVSVEFFEKRKRPFPYNAMKYFKMTGGRPSKYNGAGPYNNFHVSRVDFWRSKDWQSFFQAMEKEQLFMKHCVGDANVH